jgi:hypothetical protein
MRIQRLHVNDLAAGLLVAGATAIYAAGAAGADLPGLGGVRARACAVFIIGMLACGTGARRDAFLVAIGVLTLVVGVTAIALASTEFLTALIAGIVVLWLGATVRHLVSPLTIAPPSQEAPRELVKR